MVGHIKVKIDNLLRKNVRDMDREHIKKELASTFIVGTLDETVS